MKWHLKIGCLVVLALALGSCTFGDTESGRGGSSSDYRFLFDHNANVLDGYTVRWESNTIKVFTDGIPGAEAAINRWSSWFSFSFVGSPPTDGITLSWTSSGSVCGVTTTFYLNSGKITQAQARIHSNQTGCRGGLSNTITHEVGHALGFFGHTADGGLMDSDGGNSDITSAVRNFMGLLYSRPMGWDIRSFLSLSTKLNSGRYHPQGTQTLVRVDY